MKQDNKTAKAQLIKKRYRNKSFVKPSCRTGTTGRNSTVNAINKKTKLIESFFVKMAIRIAITKGYYTRRPKVAAACFPVADGQKDQNGDNGDIHFFTQTCHDIACCS